MILLRYSEANVTTNRAPWARDQAVNCFFTDKPPKEGSSESGTTTTGADEPSTSSEVLKGHSFFLVAGLAGVVVNHAWLLFCLRTCFGMPPSRVPSWARFPQVEVVAVLAAAMGV